MTHHQALADVYSVGICTWRLLAGRDVFRRALRHRNQLHVTRDNDPRQTLRLYLKSDLVSFTGHTLHAPLVAVLPATTAPLPSSTAQALLMQICHCKLGTLQLVLMQALHTCCHEACPALTAPISGLTMQETHLNDPTERFAVGYYFEADLEPYTEGLRELVVNMLQPAFLRKSAGALLQMPILAQLPDQ